MSPQLLFQLVPSIYAIVSNDFEVRTQSVETTEDKSHPAPDFTNRTRAFLLRPLPNQAGRY